MFGIFNTTTIPALEQTLSFSQKRHELLAGNLANLDTPGYRAKDLDVGDFQNALAESGNRKGLQAMHIVDGPIKRINNPKMEWLVTCQNCG